MSMLLITDGNYGYHVFQIPMGSFENRQWEVMQNRDLIGTASIAHSNYHLGDFQFG